MTATVSSQPRRFTPGCLMFMVGGSWLIIIAAYMIWSMYGQLREIKTFAGIGAKPVAWVEPPQEEKQALLEKINAFGAAVGRKEKAALRLTVPELNALLVSQDETRAMKESARVDSIGQYIRMEISVPINGVPFSGDRYYINGFADLSPEKNKDLGVQLQTRNLTVPGKIVTPGFLAKYKEFNPLDSLLMDNVRKSSNASIMEVLRKVGTMRLEPGAVVLEYAP